MKCICFAEGERPYESDANGIDFLRSMCPPVTRQMITPIRKAPDVCLKQWNNYFVVSTSRFPTKNPFDSYYHSVYHSNNDKITIDEPGTFGSHLWNQTGDHLTILKTPAEILKGVYNGKSKNFSCYSCVQQ